MTGSSDHSNTAALERGRSYHAARAWADAYVAFELADRHAPLGIEDLQRLVWAAGLIGRDEDMIRVSERLHQALLDAGALAAAARCAFWAGFRLFALGESARAGAWLARAERAVEQLGGECVECGYLLVPQAYRQAARGEYNAAYATATRCVALAERFGDRDLIAFGRNVQGRNLLRLGRVQEGLALMDEAMLAASSGGLSPIVTGLVYCSLIAGCQQAFAFDRAREWTQLLERWWEDQPQLVVFSASCLVHRAELMEQSGAWTQAVAEARRATDPLRSAVERQAAADAHYRQGEIQRLRGAFAEAEEAYRNAHQLGREPQPGLALLWLAQGRTEAAVQAIRRVLSAPLAGLERAQYLPAFCEIMLAAGELEAAAAGCEELAEIAVACGSEVLEAMAAHARGAWLLAQSKPEAALEPLRSALALWQRMAAPYLVARLRVLAAAACRALGDQDSAENELALARAVFRQLGAAPDLARIGANDAGSAPSVDPTRSPQHNLSPRELQVLRLVASGKTNKLIARELHLSEKTVDRHVSNILTKIAVPTRAAATAYAYQHKLV